MLVLIFFDGRPGAGLGDDVRVLALYLAGSAALGYLVSLARDLLPGCKSPKRRRASP